MHEMSYMINFINMAEAAAKNEPGAKISAIEIAVGEMTGLLPEYLEKYFPEASAGTRCAGARLKIDYIPVRVRCNDCQNIYHPDRDHGYRCPSCDSGNATLIEGRQLELKSISLE